ncbi:Uncharacterized protein SVXHr_0643 [Halorhabdus sp. SVX81]|uniref:Hvo_1808 family surface protein n=1 Tax=Halorhabdus sp. SVX81 TaxID=2978283 RepID=UPI0023DA6B35|nr:Hvo_1808 family surface protein [Halorhabdus sp. SVX81]WEL16822.1 Uncharacterized protein SVXHr_0643 [Halorhabdus sp. SVX81]
MVSRTKLMAAVAVIALALQPVTVATAAATDAPTPTTSDSLTVGDVPQASENETEPNETHPPDPAADVLGWENGYWYNETIAVTPEDGLNESELGAVVNRSMARVEQIRRLEFEETVPVEVIGREEFETTVDNSTETKTDAQRLRMNVTYEALLMVNESTDAVAVEADNQGSSIGGFYDPVSEQIRIVSENTSTPKMNEITLSQELYHALQHQQFGQAIFNHTTREAHNAKDGIVEGDGNYVDRLYQQRCQNEWAGSCLMPNTAESTSTPDFHYGLLQIYLQPYIDGPPFVQDLREEGGWEAVNAVYDEVPASTEQTIHPEKYPRDTPANITVPDRSAEEWRPLSVESGPNYASVGEAGLYVTLWYPAMQTQGAVSIIPLRNHMNYGPDGEIQDFDRYNYNHTYTAGWDGDKLIPYVPDDSSGTNETGYVYKTVWDSPEDAEEFQEGYERLLTVHGAESVDGRNDTYRIPNESGYSDAFYLNRTGDRFTIVNAPNVEELSAVREGAAPEAEETTSETEESTPAGETTEADESTTESDETTDDTTTDTETATEEPDTPTESGDETGDESEATENRNVTDEQSTETTTASGPGFTFGAAILALVALLGMATRPD